ncbi:MAG: hypothetical protein R2706_12315 [Acidimicrobiales bacterium]
METLANLKPAFAEDGRITAGNSSQISDGALRRAHHERREGSRARTQAASTLPQLRRGRNRPGHHAQGPNSGHREDPRQERPHHRRHRRI